MTVLYNSLWYHSVLYGIGIANIDVMVGSQSAVLIWISSTACELLPNTV